MRKCVMVMVMAILAFGSFAQAETVVIQDQTELGDDPGIQDAELFKPLPYDIEGRGCPECGDKNGGASVEFTLYSDGGPFQNNDIGPRHQLFQFDVSSLEGKEIINAEFVFNIHPRNRRKSCCIPIAEMKLSRLLSGNDWIEGDQNGDEAYPGEVTWNSRKHNLNPPWFPPGGATSPAEIDMASTVTIDYIAGLRTGEIREHTINVTDFVQAWADGAENNGMVLWGGYVPEATTCEKHFILFSMKLMTSEAPPDQRFSIYPDGVQTDYYTTLEDRPALVVEIPLYVNVDILPHDDPNLFTVNTQGKGRLPIAILGSEDYDISQIDINTISVADVVMPVKEPKAEDDVNGDGLTDLMVHVSRRDLILALGLDLLEPGTEVPVTVKGSLLDGGPFVGTDTVILVARED